MKTAKVKYGTDGHPTSFTVHDARDNVLSVFTPSAILTVERAKNDAEMCAHYHRMSVSLTPKRLKLRKVDPQEFSTGQEFRGRPYYGVEITLYQSAVSKAWRYDGTVDGVEVSAEFKTRKAALESIADFGADDVPTRNILNPDGGEFMIARSQKGGCCDPATETYHSM